MKRFGKVLLATALISASTLAQAGWKLDAAASEINFTSVKKLVKGEVHSFKKFTGGVSDDGKAVLKIDLASLETGIDIRNQRMREHLFDIAKFPEATFRTKLDYMKYAKLKPGEVAKETLKGKISLHGIELATEVKVTVAKVGKGRLLVQSQSPLLISAGDFKLAKGIEKLRELASLPSITQVVPVTFSLQFLHEHGKGMGGKHHGEGHGHGHKH